MRSMDAVLPLSGGIGIFVSVTTVVSPATGGSRVGCGVGAPDPAGLAAVVGVGLGAAVVALGAAVVAIAAAVGDGEGPAAEPHALIRSAPAARIANLPAPNRTSIVVPPKPTAGKYANSAAGAGASKENPQLRGDNDFGPGLTAAEITHRLATLGEGIGAIDRRAQLARLDEVLEIREVFEGALCDVELHALAKHPSPHHHIDDPSKEPDPTDGLRGADLHEDAVWRQDAP